MEFAASMLNQPATRPVQAAESLEVWGSVQAAIQLVVVTSERGVELSIMILAIKVILTSELVL
jgi:hypothetical protein